MNDMTFTQAAQVLNGVVQQMTGQTALATIATPEDFVTVAQTALKGGFDPVINAIAQLWGRTIFAYRAYRGRYEGMRMELDRFGAGSLHMVVNRVRKKLLRQLHATIDDAIDKAGAPLLGVVPEDDALPLSLNRGIPLLLADSRIAAAAYYNIAKRIQGHRVPLLRIR